MTTISDLDRAQVIADLDTHRPRAFRPAEFARIIDAKRETWAMPASIGVTTFAKAFASSGHLRRVNLRHEGGNPAPSASMSGAAARRSRSPPRSSQALTSRTGRPCSFWG